jgi:hypothetical protein
MVLLTALLQNRQVFMPDPVQNMHFHEMAFPIYWISFFIQIDFSVTYNQVFSLDNIHCPPNLHATFFAAPLSLGQRSHYITLH